MNFSIEFSSNIRFYSSEWTLKFERTKKTNKQKPYVINKQWNKKHQEKEGNGSSLADWGFNPE